MKRKINKYILIFSILPFIVASCKVMNDLGNKLDRKIGPLANKYYNYEWCGAEFYKKYHPDLRIKTCTNVVKRKCVQKKYCKGDLDCEKEVYQYYKPYIIKNDEEYCACLVKAKRGNEDFKVCNEIS